MSDEKLKLEQLGRLSVEEFAEKEKFPITVVLDNVRSAANVGSVFRTSDAFAIKEIILLGITPCPPHREILKSAIGATESVAWKHFSEYQDFYAYAEQQNLMMVAVEQTKNSIEIDEMKITQNVAVVFGNEVDGVSQEIIDKSSLVLELPQYGTKHSLNISVCAGIVLWELVRKLHSI